ncbi:hypothetical protein [Leucobacter sp. 1207-22]|uniref:hypothetical protein n=1 Tax=Leucobacter sp. 1207-22 TaxID=2604456 RepID=UPI00406409E5
MAAVSFLLRFACFFSLAVIAAGFLTAFWPLSLDISLSSFPGVCALYVTLAHRRVNAAQKLQPTKTIDTEPKEKA